MVAKYDIVRIVRAAEGWGSYVPEMGTFPGRERLYFVTNVWGVVHDDPDWGRQIDLKSVEIEGRLQEADAWTWPEASLEVVTPAVDMEQLIHLSRDPRIGSDWNVTRTMEAPVTFPLPYIQARVHHFNGRYEHKFIPLRAIATIEVGGAFVDHTLEGVE